MTDRAIALCLVASVVLLGFAVLAGVADLVDWLKRRGTR